MEDKTLQEIFTPDKLSQIFPASKSDQFFEALYGDATEGAYDISLHFKDNSSENSLQFELHLNQRPGKCLACNLTYGLPEVFSRHPGINLADVAKQIAQALDKDPAKASFNLGTTISTSSDLHIIPLAISVS